MAEYFPAIPHSITVWEEPKEILSHVLNKHGEPYSFIVQKKIGFDLTPRNKKDDGTSQAP